MKTSTVHFYYCNIFNPITISLGGFLYEGICKKVKRDDKRGILLHKIHCSNVSVAFIPN